MSSVVIAGDTSGAITLAAPAVAGTNTITLPAATGNVVLDSATQTLTNKTIQGGTITSGTAVASTSGTSIDFTSIPSWVKRVTVMFNGVSTNGSSHLLVQIGAGSVTTSGYTTSTGAAINSGTSGFYASSTAGFLIYNGNAANIYNGTSTIFNVSSNTWTNTHVIGGTDASRYGGGSIALSGTLDRVRITTVGGTDTFDAGSINILYE
jgi:hypothetical protein